jgi:hypothetical protein
VVSVKPQIPLVSASFEFQSFKLKNKTLKLKGCTGREKPNRFQAEKQNFETLKLETDFIVRFLS